MAIEIRELIIRTQITDSDKRVSRNHLNEKEIIDRCVEKVLKKLKKKTDR